MQLIHSKKERRLITLFIGIVVSCMGCYRPGKTNIDNTHPTYSILVDDGNWSDLQSPNVNFEVISGDTLLLRFHFRRRSGNPINYPITFYIDSLPTGISASIDSTSFKLDYDLPVKFVANADTGLYPITISTIDVKDGLQKHPFHLRVLPVPPELDCAPCLSGDWTCSDACSSHGSYTSNITTVPGTPHTINISNFSNLGDTIIVLATVSCKFDIIIPLQNINSYTIWGEVHSNSNFCGFSDLQFNIPYTVVHNGDTQNCSISLRSW